MHTALTDRRPYRDPLAQDLAFARMRQLAGSQLEPALLRRYEAVMREPG